MWAALRFHGAPPPFSDSWTHLLLAEQWRSGDGLGSSAEISAGYPLYVAGTDVVRWLTNAPLTLVQAVGVSQALAGGAVAVLAGVLGRRVAGPAVGLTSAGLLALWPNLVLIAPLPLAEAATTVACLVMVLLLSTPSRPSRAALAGAGVALGVAVQLRPSCLVLGALFLTVPSEREWRARGRPLLVGGVAAALVIVPFAARSSIVTQSFVPFDLRAGVNLCLGRAPGADHPPIDRAECPIPDGTTALEADRLRRQQAWESLRDDPGREPRLVLVRARVTLWDADRSSIDEIARQDGRQVSDDVARRLSDLSTLLSRVVVVLAALGTVVAVAGRHAALGRVAAAGWLLLLPALVALGDPRYRIPSLPFLAIAACGGVTVLLRGRSRANRLSS